MINDVNTKLQNTLNELALLLSFMVDCEGCPLEYSCKRIKEQHQADLCELLLSGDI